MKPLNALLLSTALTVASHAHSQADLASLPAGLLGGILPGVLDLTNQALPLVNGLLSNDLVGGLVGDLVLPLTSNLLDPVLGGTLLGLDSSLPLVNGLISNDLVNGLVGSVVFPLTSGLLDPVLNGVLPIVNTAVIPLVGGVVSGGVL
ncbi:MULTISPECIES: hypothetical protein [Zhongshania]|uniref:Uncharacterized protein n=1 Tax=Zhongshania marina TaxID=2304603 RepID=A0ABX9W6T5_9GAMM|nr:hypothetical protein [Zhongshania aliphaticivorans]RNL65945.1 hypothetical protein D0911_06185 [Zhongshania marina]CAA0102481.1 Uncharacterised protein [Zhongshania aliphaticivorans]